MDRIGASLGILHVVLGLLGFLIHGYPEIGASPQQLAAWASATAVGRFEAGIYIEALGFLLLVPFAAWLYSLFRRTERATGWVLTAGFGAAVAFVAMTMPINEVWTAMLHGGKRGLDPLVMASIRDIAQLSFEATFVFLGLFMAATALLFFQTRLLPSWVRWGALIIAVAMFVPPLAMNASLLFWLWVLAVSSYLLVRPRSWERSIPPRGAASSAATGAV